MSTLEQRQQYRASLRKRKDQAGLCFRCSRPRLPGIKVCSSCKETHRQAAQNRYYANVPLAREKRRLAAKRAYHNDPQKALAYQRERYRKHPDLFRGYELKQHYGISLAQYREMEHKQNGLCALCRKPPMVGKRAAGKEQQPPCLYVDHNHKSGMVRGLLCHWCNSHIIAGIEKSGASLTQIAQYLGVSY